MNSEKANVKRVLITGATSGIGFSTTIQLCELGHTVVFTARNEEKGEKTLKAVKSLLPCANVSYCVLDLDSFESVEQATVELVKLHDPFDVVILNAAVMLPPESQTIYGLDSTFQVNFLTHYFLALKLVKAKPEGHHLHIVCLSSVLLKLFDGFPWRIPKNEMKFERLFSPKEKSGWKSYALSKFALAAFSETLNLEEDVSAVAVNPGNSMTSVSRHMSLKRKRLFKIFKSSLIPVEDAARNVVRAALQTIPSGHFLDKEKIVALPRPVTDHQSQKHLINMSEKILDRIISSRISEKSATL
ncbi:unnamed protein product, partial [Mesorhabditis belari]|uniref:Uncharacterized protein n=1 Tax=Mesorhabditis belari TaxID=2138241 RepID=A0AAF3EKE9_9BILA